MAIKRNWTIAKAHYKRCRRELVQRHRPRLQQGKKRIKTALMHAYHSKHQSSQ
ncbi:hypothetical protein [Moraxella catarrhalis]|uniref:hypothetical protein n=1 Tax=Moraxella catarrhalis TaxID=480 RepID=UPI001600FCC8|nr:hypothetical protein [Moraxella catarrhalis]MCG6835596.1 hypothetical protein [Moraxella catarrhalis]